jgi:chromosome partitioning protein
MNDSEKRKQAIEDSIEIKKYYAGKLFKTTVSRTVRLSEAPSYGEPIQYYDKHAKGAEAYNKVAKEILERI